MPSHPGIPARPPNTAPRSPAAPRFPGADLNNLVVLEGPPAAPDNNNLLVVQESATQPKSLPGERSGELSVDEDSEIVLDEDIWNWKENGLGGFLKWVANRLETVPAHDGKKTTGLERAIAYFERINKEITGAMQQDFRNQINTAEAEVYRDQVEDGLESLLKRLNQVRKSKFKRYRRNDNQPEGIVKEAAGSTAIHGIIVTVPLIISRIARVCINGTVASGHSIEDSFWRLSEKYELTKRERAELEQLLADMGYWIRRDRGYLLDEDIVPSSVDKFDWQSNVNS